MEKFNDSRSTYDTSYAANNNNNITKSLNEPDVDNRRGDDDDDEREVKRCSRESARKIWSPMRSSPSPSSSSELDVESRLASPDIDVTKCGTTPPPPMQQSQPAVSIVQVTTRKPPVTAKNSEAFSVSSLLKPDAPRTTRHPFNNHHHHHQPHHQQHHHQQQQPPTMTAADTISVTRSLMYPAVQFPDLIKDTRKEVHLHSSAANTLLQKHFSGFSFHPHFYSAANMLNPSSGSPEHVGSGAGSGGSGDPHTDNNHNLLTSSLYLSLGAVQAAAAAAFVHPLSTTGKSTTYPLN